MKNPQLTSAYRRMKPQFQVHPPYGVVIGDVNHKGPSDFPTPIQSLSEAHIEAIYITTELCRRISGFPKNKAEALFAYVIGHEFYHFLDALMVLPEKQTKAAKKLRLKPIHPDRLEQMADSFGIVIARQAGYDPEIANISTILKH